MTQTTNRWIQANAVNETQIRLRNGGILRGRNSGDTADIPILAVNSGNVPEFQTLPVALSTLPIPSQLKQFATIEYIQNYVIGKTSAKTAVDYLAVTDISGTWSAGDATTPASLTGTSALTVDGKTFGAGDVTVPPKRVALVGQTAQEQGGWFDVTAAGPSSFTLTRSADGDGISDPDSSEVSKGVYFPITQGDTYAGYEVLLTNTDVIVLNTTPLTWSYYPSANSIMAGDGISRSGNTLSINLLANGGLISTNPGAVGGQIKIQYDVAATESMQTVKVDASGNVIAKKMFKAAFTLTATDISNQYLDLSDVAGNQSVQLAVQGAPPQFETKDYTVNYTGGTGGKTRASLANGLASGGVSALISGDYVEISYMAYP